MRARIILAAAAALAAFGIAGAIPGAGAEPTSSTGPATLDARCEYGITRAFAGDLEQAEAVFLSVLSSSPRDPRALNDLGNVSLMRGETQLALAFYGRALKADSADAGIRLNRATAWMLMGDDERARAEASEGIRRAGGLKAASALVGLHTGPEAGEEPSKAARGAWLSREEVRALLQAAVKSVPADSARAGTAPASGTARPKKAGPAVRSAGPRGAEGSDAVNVLYWKR
jgi:tetratricopeptide (TPR) repeat protein